MGIFSRRMIDGAQYYIERYRDVSFRMDGLLGAIQTVVNSSMNDEVKVNCIKTLLDQNYEQNMSYVE